MGFVYPPGLLLLLPAAGLLLLLIWNYRKHRRITERMFSPANRRLYLPGVRLWLRIVAVACLVLAVGGPYWGVNETSLNSRQKEIYFLLDVSSSMNCPDLKPTRLVRAKELIKELSLQLQGERLGLIAFTDYGFTLCPLTRDVKMLHLFVDLVETHQYGNRGTDYRKALLAALRRFPEKKGLFSTRQKRYIVMISDGENFSEAYQSVINKMKSNGVRVVAVGLGTDRPCGVVDKDPSGMRRPVLQENGLQAQSLFQSKDLELIAKESNGRYYRMRSTDDPQAEIMNFLQRQSASAAERLLILQKHNQYMPLTGVAMVCWLLSICLLPLRKWASRTFS